MWVSEIMQIRVLIPAVWFPASEAILKENVGLGGGNNSMSDGLYEIKRGRNWSVGKFEGRLLKRSWRGEDVERARAVTSEVHFL